MQKRTDFFDNSFFNAVPDKPLATRNKPHNNQLCADLSRFISAYSVVSHFLRFAWQTTPFQSYEKDWGKDDFTKIPNGCAGIENMYPYMLSAANEGKITFNKAVELCSYNPAKIFGCDAKGAIEVGKDADIVIYNPTKDFTITNDKMHSDCDHTIWEGIKVKGYPEATYSRGKLVFKDGEFLGERGWGKFIKRSSSGNL